jgi:chemotaxis protein methyltransferase CheR
VIADADCVQFLQRVLPRLGLHWPGFRKVRRLVCKRVGRRLRTLGVPGLAAYQEFLEAHPEEWRALEELCRVPISRFYRDRAVFEALEREVLPALAQTALDRRQIELSCWSACCASGEEPYTLAALWHLRLAARFPGVRLHLVASDVDSHLLRRARSACYRASSLKELPTDLLAQAFARAQTQFRLAEALRTVDFVHQDIRALMPAGPFDLILCRNSVLTYFAEPLRRQVMARVVGRLRNGGALVVGTHECPPEGLALERWSQAPAIYRRTAPADG